MLGDDGRPLSGAEVFLGEESDLDVFESQRRTGGDGRFRLRGVGHLASTLIVRAPGYAGQIVALRLPRDVLGAEPLTVRMLRGSTVEVEVEAPDAEGMIVALRRGGRVLATAEVDASGRAAFANCSPGEYVVQQFGDDQQRATVTVDRSGDVVRVRL